MAGGLLFDGPINNINHNLHEILNAILCIYDELKRFSCQQSSEFMSVFDQTGHVFESIQQRLLSQRREMKKVAELIANDLKGSVQGAMKTLKAQMEDISRELESVRSIVDFPRNVINKLCSDTKSVLAGTQGFIGVINGSIGGAMDKFFGGRRKRSVVPLECGIPSLLPHFDVSLPGIDFKALEEWIESIFKTFAFATIVYM